ncbi:MAG: VOC family protein [Alphaproteobacteria bacterium]|nr:VOC family protein [Alphaproteobacteria bacterium]
MIEINGIAHIILTVSNFELCVPFYEKMLPFLGMTQIFLEDGYLYYVGGRTAIGIRRASPEYQKDHFIQSRIGLHHFCLRARDKKQVDLFYEFLCTLNTKIIHPPEEGNWAPGYYSVLFEDPDGIRIEMNYVPGKGLLELNN